MTDSDHAPLPTRCISCGAEVPDDAKSCHACGSAVYRTEDTSPLPDQYLAVWIRATHLLRKMAAHRRLYGERIVEDDPTMPRVASPNSSWVAEPIPSRTTSKSDESDNVEAYATNRQDQDQADKPKSGVLDFGANMLGAVCSALAMAGYAMVGFQPELCGVDQPICVATLLLLPVFPALLLAGVVTAIGAMVWRADQRRTPKIGSFNAWGWFVGVFVWSSALLFLIFAITLNFAWTVWIPSR